MTSASLVLPSSFRAFTPPSDTNLDGFTQWAQDLRLQENPDGPIEEALLDRLIRTAWRLRLAETTSDGAPPTDRDSLRILTEAERAWSRVLSDWTRFRKARKTVKPSPRAASSTESDSSPPEPPTNPEPQPYTPPSCPVSWPDHVTFDPSISSTHLIIKDTNLFVDHVAAMLEEGWTPEEIHRDFPSLNGTQIEAARLCDAAGQSGPPHQPPLLSSSDSLHPAQPITQPL